MKELQATFIPHSLTWQIGCQVKGICFKCLFWGIWGVWSMKLNDVLMLVLLLINWQTIMLLSVLVFSFYLDLFGLDLIILGSILENVIYLHWAQVGFPAYFGSMWHMFVCKEENNWSQCPSIRLFGIFCLSWSNLTPYTFSVILWNPQVQTF